MSDYQLETAFLKNCLLYDGSAQRDKLLARMAELQGNERCVKRAGWIMIFISSMALATLGYHAVLLTEYPATLAQFIMPWTIKICIALSVTSMICLLAFAGLGSIYRKEHNDHRQECRRLIENFLQCRLGSKAADAPIHPAAVQEPTVNSLRSRYAPTSEPIGDAQQPPSFPRIA